MYNCLIIDDDELDRLTISLLLKKFPDFNIVHCCSSIASAKYFIENGTIDVIFTDINMPEISGLDFRKQNLNIPVCVFITSYPEFALESYETNTFDYLTKPVSLLRLTDTVDKIKSFFEVKAKASSFESAIGSDIVFIKEGRNHTKIKLHDIIYLEALKDYTILTSVQKKHFVLKGLGKLLEEDTYKSFVRVHRGFAVQKHYIKHINSREIVLKNNVSIPIGKFYRENIESML
ncbi:LytTR family DNA-binding domain-containing protein [Flavobacterium enshiense]|uniref:LytR/AlgR family response regulator transcription factor n=1 Tax=Flavobacterium enshiense TaxID=1341165 RepID=UPI00345CD4B8